MHVTGYAYKIKTEIVSSHIFAHNIWIHLGSRERQNQHIAYETLSNGRLEIAKNVVTPNFYAYKCWGARMLLFVSLIWVWVLKGAFHGLGIPDVIKSLSLCFSLPLGFLNKIKQSKKQINK